MSVVIAIGLALITAFLALSVFVKPSDIGAWLQGFAIVAVLALMAISEWRRRNGRSLWSGMSPRNVAYWNVGLGALFVAIGVMLLWKESYINGTLHLVCGFGVLGLGLFWVSVLPNSTMERDASKIARAPHRGR